MARTREKDEDWDAALGSLRVACDALPSVTETLTFGNPTFKVGRNTFAVLDIYRGSTCVWILCAPEDRTALLAQPGFFPAPYDRAGTAVCRLAADIDWPAFAGLIRQSHALAL